MRTDIFNFDLPADRIAQQPVSPRDSAKLLSVRPNGFSNYHITDFPALLKETDVLVFNDTKVLPARLTGFRQQAKIQVTLFKQVHLCVWETLIKNARRLRVGDIISFADDFNAVVLEKKQSGAVVLKFNVLETELFSKLEKYGIMPLPPYIKRSETGDSADNQSYQTIFAKNLGAVAAPTAGLHFTENVFKQLQEKGIQKEFVTLHVGGGTFLPVKVDDTDSHVMHSEYGEITEQVAMRLNEYKRQGRRIIPIGTTALRLLESASDKNGVLHPFAQETDIFITPGYQFKFIDALWTNFHLPMSTLFMLVCAFAGIEHMQAAYQFAIENNYRFFSYGDASFIERA